MIKVLVLIVLLLLIPGPCPSAQAANKPSTDQMELSHLSDNIFQAINDGHYTTAETLLSSFQSLWATKKSAISPDYRASEALEVIIFDLEKSLKDPSHSALIHDGLAFNLVVASILNNGKQPDLSQVKIELIPPLIAAQKQLKNGDEDFSAAFNRWELSFSAFEPVFYLTKTDNKYHQVMNDIKGISALLEKGSPAAKLNQKLLVLKSDLNQLMNAPDHKEQAQTIFSEFQKPIYFFSVMIGIVVLFILFRSKRKKASVY